MGQGHPEFAISLWSLANLYTSTERFAEAESLYFKTLAIFTDRLGEQHPNTRSAFNGLVNLIAAAIQADQADTLSDHPMTQDLIPKIRTAMENQDE
ncbi:MAG: tetratricopeptide repeat protein [Leptolyngbyaceae cyanobacterium]